MIQDVINCYAMSASGGDPQFANTVLLLGFDGTAGDNTVDDESASNHSNVFGFGNATKSATAKFGTASFIFDGSGDKIEYPDSADWDFGAGDFTIEAWIRFTNLTGFQTIACQWPSAGSGGAWLFDFPGSANNVLRFGRENTGGTQTFQQYSWAPSANTWYHVCAERSGNTIRLYADGAMLGSAAYTDTLRNSSNFMTIGSLTTAGASTTNGFKGHIDELRITKGVARYASDSGYTVPTAAFPRS